jgi:hypothetical protein
MDKKGRGKGPIIFFLLIIVALLVWGYIVAKQTPDLSTCNIHFGVFCWKWGAAAVK